MDTSDFMALLSRIFSAAQYPFCDAAWFTLVALQSLIWKFAASNSMSRAEVADFGP
jgi:hypothetical protein